MTVSVLRGLLKIENEKKHAKSIEKTNLFFKGRLRWNILINLIIIAVVAIPFLVPILVTFIINAYFVLLWFIFLLIATIKHFRIQYTMYKFKKLIGEKNDKPNIVDSKYKYVMTTFAYKEPLDLLLKNLNNISSIHGSEETIMMVCLEERTPDLEYKITTISNLFESKFREIIITVHPFQVEGEIPGKCSNNNYGMRQLYNHLRSTQLSFKPEDYIITSFDVDTLFDKNYLNILKSSVNKEKKVDKVVWQPLLYYNWDFHKLSFFTRIVGIMRSTLMAGALTTFNINIMSVYTASLKLYLDGNFVHPFYQMEDIICYIRWMTVSKNYIRIKPIYCATLSGPTSGKNMLIELKEMIRQSHRWAIGSAEVFHYFMVKMKRINVFISIIWAFNYLNYYACFLCAQSLLMISTNLKLYLFSNEDKSYMNRWFFVLLILVYAMNLWMILLNKLAVITFLRDLKVKEYLDSMRELFHFILCLPTQIFYSIVVFSGFVTIIISGKNACKHSASKKDDLKV